MVCCFAPVVWALATVAVGLIADVVAGEWSCQGAVVADAVVASPPVGGPHLGAPRRSRGWRGRREVWRPFYAGPVDALVHWLALLPFGLLMALRPRRPVEEGHAGVLASDTFEWLRLLVVAPLRLLAMRAVIENDDWWRRWLFAGPAAMMVTLAALRGVVRRPRPAVGGRDRYGKRRTGPVRLEHAGFPAMTRG